MGETKLTHRLVAENRERELWFLDANGNAYFFPRGWADAFKDAQAEEPELYGYYPTHTHENSPVDVGYVVCSDLESMREATEADAHPALREYLDTINAGDDPRARWVRMMEDYQKPEEAQ